MYCEKLLSIIDHPMSNKYNLSHDIITLLNEFLINETGVTLPEKINPIKFAIKHDVDDIIAVMCFIIGSQTGLFNTRTYYNCSKCNEMHEVEDIRSPLLLDCECHTVIIPNDYRENVFLFFKLLFEPEKCNIEHYAINYVRENPIDIYLSDLDLGKPNVSLTMVDNIVGIDVTNNLLGQRDNSISKQIEGEISSDVAIKSKHATVSPFELKEESVLEKAKPTIFIGSSVENLDVAYAIQTNLEHESEPTVWSQGVFQLSSSAIRDLLKILNHVDFAVFVFSPDDITNIRKQEMQTVRDNVVFEMGMFIGGLGIERTFFLIPKDSDQLHLPTDLIGIEPGRYNSKRDDGNLIAALGPVCHGISRKMKELGKK